MSINDLLMSNKRVTSGFSPVTSTYERLGPYGANIYSSVFNKVALVLILLVIQWRFIGCEIVLLFGAY